MSAFSLAINRSFLGLLLANTLLGAAMPILLILGGLAGLMLAPTPGLATLPASVQTLASLLASAPFSLLMGRLGRATGFALGAGLTVIAALLAVQAMSADNFVLLCVAHFIFGAGLASFQFFRFAAAEAVSKTWQPVAISLMLTSGLIAALAGPQLVIAAKDMLAPVPLAGAYGALVVTGLLGLIPLAFIRLPRATPQQHAPQKPRAGVLIALRKQPIRRAIAIAAVSQGGMMFLMVPTPMAMIGCGFDENTASDVIRWHIVAMFAPSFATGFIIQRFGAQRVALIGLLGLILAAIWAALGITAWHFYGALIVLGLGWNFSFIGATSMLAAAVSETDKAAVQGVNDTLIALVSTLCAFAAGLVISSLGWALLALILIPVVLLALGALTLDKAGPDLGEV